MPRRVGERFVEGDGGEGHRQSAREHDAALHRFHEPGHARVAGVVVAPGVRDADDGPGECIVREAHRLDERLAEEEGEVLVPVAGEALAHPPRRPTVRHRPPLTTATESPLSLPPPFRAAGSQNVLPTLRYACFPNASSPAR